MPLDAQALGIDQMTVAELLQLRDMIDERLPDQVDPRELTDAQMKEILRRRQEADENPGVGRPWREVIDDLRKKYP
jgi:hypothetical protein